jgi:hypothetical protein
VRWRVVAGGMLLAFVLAMALLKVPPLTAGLSMLNDSLAAIERSLLAGTSLVFGYLGGGAAPYEVTDPTARSCSPSAHCRWCSSSPHCPRSLPWGILPALVRMLRGC